MKRKKAANFHGLRDPLVHGDGSVQWRYVGTEANRSAVRQASRWAEKVVALAVGDRVNAISPAERRHI